MLNCGISKWSDMTSEWYTKVLKETGQTLQVMRKQWEIICLLQAIKERGLIGPDKKGLVFGVGREWTVSYLAGLGCEIVATDMLPNNTQVKHWNNSNQFCETIENLRYNVFCSSEDFDRRVKFRSVDMNNIPEDLQDFDFCWSLCALEHLGSSDNGINFIMNSIRCLKPGGIAFHSTEFDCDPDTPKYETVDNVFYKQQDIEELVRMVEENGWYIEPQDYSLGDHLYDYPTKDIGGSRHLKIFSGPDCLVSSIRLIIRR